MHMQHRTRIGRRLRVARDRAGLTQQQLADRLGLQHHQIVSRIEDGERSLNANELIMAMDVLGVDLDYFTDAFRLEGEGEFSFRTSTDVSREVIDGFERRAGRWIAMYRELSREQGQRPRWLGHALSLRRTSSFEDAMAAGEAVADRFDLGPRPAERLRTVMQDQLGILVLDVDAPPGVSGAASRISGLNCVLINRREPEGRRSFDLAHELFHLLTWDAMPPERTEAVQVPRRGKGWRTEKLAENFAAAVLMPGAIVQKHWESRSPAADPHDLLKEGAARLQVSASAYKWRLRNLDLLSKRQIDALDDGRLVGNSRSRCDAPMPSLFSRHFVKPIAVALDTGRLSARRAATILDLSLRELAALLQSYGHEAYFEA